MNSRRAQTCGFVLLPLGIVLILVGSLVSHAINEAVDDAVDKAVVVDGCDDPDTDNWVSNGDHRDPIWRKAFYIWNVTNIEDVWEDPTNVAPCYEEVGPFFYQLIKDRIDVQFIGEEVHYKMWDHFHFLKERSCTPQCQDDDDDTIFPIFQINFAYQFAVHAPHPVTNKPLGELGLLACVFNSFIAGARNSAFELLLDPDTSQPRQGLFGTSKLLSNGTFEGKLTATLASRMSAALMQKTLPLFRDTLVGVCDWLGDSDCNTPARFYHFLANNQSKRIDTTPVNARLGVVEASSGWTLPDIASLLGLAGAYTPLPATTIEALFDPNTAYSWLHPQYFTAWIDLLPGQPVSASFVSQRKILLRMAFSLTDVQLVVAATWLGNYIEASNPDFWYHNRLAQFIAMDIPPSMGGFGASNYEIPADLGYLHFGSLIPSNGASSTQLDEQSYREFPGFPEWYAWGTKVSRDTTYTQGNIVFDAASHAFTDVQQMKRIVDGVQNGTTTLGGFTHREGAQNAGQFLGVFRYLVQAVWKDNDPALYGSFAFTHLPAEVQAPLGLDTLLRLPPDQGGPIDTVEKFCQDLFHFRSNAECRLWYEYMTYVLGVGGSGQNEGVLMNVLLPRGRLWKRTSPRDLLFGTRDDPLVKALKNERGGSALFTNYTSEEHCRQDVHRGFSSMFTGAHDLSVVGSTNRWRAMVGRADGTPRDGRFVVNPGSGKSPWGTPDNTYVQVVRVQGSEGLQFPPRSTNGDTLDLWSTTLWRPLTLHFAHEETVAGIKLRRYDLTDETISKHGEGQSTYHVYYNGVHNFTTAELSPSIHGVPALLTLPHALRVEEQFWTDKGAVKIRRGTPAVCQDGFAPDPDKHQAFISVEPQTGRSMNARRALQGILDIGASIQRSLFNFFPPPNSRPIPIYWASEGATVADCPRVADDFKKAIYDTQDIADVILVVPVAIGVTILFIAILLTATFGIPWKKRTPASVSKVMSVHESQIELSVIDRKVNEEEEEEEEE